MQRPLTFFHCLYADVDSSVMNVESTCSLGYFSVHSHFLFQNLLCAWCELKCFSSTLLLFGCVASEVHTRRDWAGVDGEEKVGTAREHAQARMMPRDIGQTRARSSATSRLGPAALGCDEARGAC